MSNWWKENEDFDRDYEAQPFDPAATVEQVWAESQVAKQRLPSVRRGPREPLPKWLRLLILRRDDFTCRWCFKRGGRLEVDHITPWSAGGSDASWNLRTLCSDCNQERSNFRTDSARAHVLPIVIRCMRCDDAVETPTGDDHVSAWCARCEMGTPSTRDEVEASPANNPNQSKGLTRPANGEVMSENPKRLRCLWAVEYHETDKRHGVIGPFGSEESARAWADDIDQHPHLTGLLSVVRFLDCRHDELAKKDAEIKRLQETVSDLWSRIRSEVPRKVHGRVQSEEERTWDAGYKAGWNVRDRLGRLDVTLDGTEK